MRRVGLRPDVFSGSAIAGVPVTLKTAWEARTGQNAPRVLSRKLKTLRESPCTEPLRAEHGVLLSLKVLCGLPASSTADFREQGSGLRHGATCRSTWT